MSGSPSWQPSEKMRIHLTINNKGYKAVPTLWLSNSSSGNLLQGNNLRGEKVICLKMFIAVQFIRKENWKQSKFSTLGKWQRKSRYFHHGTFYSYYKWQMYTLGRFLAMYLWSNIQWEAATQETFVECLLHVRPSKSWKMIGFSGSKDEETEAFSALSQEELEFKPW